MDTSAKDWPNSPLAIEPTHFWQRLAAQRSHFTIFGRDFDGLATFETKRKARLCRIRVSTRNLENLQHDLRSAGITESSIFPDIDGLGREARIAFNSRCQIAASRKGIRDPLASPTILIGRSLIDSQGVGVFAARPIKKGERVADGISWFDHSHVVPWSETRKLPAKTRAMVEAFCVGTPAGFIPPPELNFDFLSVEWYFNHSCNGNLGFNADGDFIARRHIEAGEELTYDYALVESNPGFKMKCHCQSERCRKVVGGSDWNMPGVLTQEDIEYMLPWLREKLEDDSKG